ncbi:MAG: carboxylating nicotinate-nucleotide diphosphorylase [Actinomycetota bacterium]
MTSVSCVSKLESYGINLDEVEHLITHAFKEDMPEGDDKTTIATIDANQISEAKMRVRKDGVLAGVCVAAMVFEKVGLSAITFSKSCGDRVSAGETILTIRGNTRDILRSERIALNFISHLSGIATLTCKWVEVIAGSGAIIRDTRKTTPGLRKLEKFAVRMGGGENHRMNLSDGAIIKDNHIAAAGSITSAINRVRKEFPGMAIEVEVDALDQLREALACGVEVILLDNMSQEMTKEAVAIAKGSKSKLESSGGLALESARAYAETGVNYLAVGALTHSAPILDIGLDF